ncbi:transglycosylase domain-containing protein [Candidatus Gottesmanbacteria bacterium]|nr:transglycosylase domain-containing protein [Candidatus Gottesmanbacteria bacterium]
MARKRKEQLRKKTKPIKREILDRVLIPLFLLALILIKIGEGTRWVFGKIIKTVLFLASVLYHILIYHINSLRLPKLALPKFPRIKPPTLPKIKISLPRITVPRFKLPTIKIAPSWKWFLAGIFFTLIFIFIPYQVFSWLSALPHPQLLTVREIPVTTKIFDRNGFLLYEIYAEQNRTPVTLAEIPKFLKEATIAIEDREFYTHPGFSPKGILRAIKETIVNRRLQGGSTITQQLVRSALLTPELTLTRKVKEIILSFWAERIYNKNQILEMYFNQVPYGGTAWGIEAAAQTYFGKSVKDLTLAESAFLAGLPASPSVYSPFGTHPELGLGRQQEVLRKMVAQGFITNQEEQEARNEKLEFIPPKTEIKAPHFVMYVKELLEKKYGARAMAMAGLRVTTTLDLPTQEMAQEIVTNEVEKLDNLRVGNGAALVTDPKTGEILAMIGSKNYFDLEDEGNVNVSLSLQQPGSAIKIVNYALALENGFSAATILDDSPITFQVAGQPPYTPVNYDGKFHGKIPLRFALGNSYNVPAVKVLAKLGVTKMIDQGRKMGITSWKDKSRYGLSLTLGGGEVTMFEMAHIYGVLANGGKRQELTAILRVSDYKGQVLEQARTRQGFPAIPEEVAFLLANILADNQARSAAFGQNSLLTIPGKTVSVKTGTSNDLRDNWAIGFTPSFVVVVWVGNNNNNSMSWVASGVTGATPIWQQIMKNLLKEKEDEPILPPKGIIKTTVCGRSEYFVKGTEKTVSCPPPPTPLPTP